MRSKNITNYSKIKMSFDPPESVYLETVSKLFSPENFKNYPI